MVKLHEGEFQEPLQANTSQALEHDLPDNEKAGQRARQPKHFYNLFLSLEGTEMLQKTLLSLLILITSSSVAFAATAPERIMLYRQSAGFGVASIWGLSGRPDNDPNDWQDSLDQTANFGWEAIIDVALADLNGDGLDDKVMWQAGTGGDPNGNPNTAYQMIVNYSGDNDISITGTPDDWTAPNGDIFTNWGWFDPNLTESTPVFLDIDKDGIDDSGIVATGAALDPNGAFFPADSLQWGAWESQGSIGISRDQGGSVNFTGYSPFGTPSLGDIPHVGDINGDGVDDRILQRPDGIGQNIFVDFSDPNGGWGDSTVDAQITLGDPNDNIGISDINGDGLDDLVLIRADPNWSPNPGVDPAIPIWRHFGHYTDPNGVLDATVDIIDVFGELNITGPWESPDKVLYGQFDLGVAPPDADFNNDGIVDGLDFLAWQRGDTPESGSAAELTLWQSQYGQTVPVSVTGNLVPEPTTFCLLSLCGMTFLGARRRR